MTCPRCRQDIPRGAKLCPKCGAPLGRSARRPPKTGVEPILNAIAKTAARLCDAHDAQIFLVDGDHLRHAAHHGSVPTTRTIGEAIPINRGTVYGRALLDRRTIHVRDMKAAVRTQYPELKARQRATGLRTMVAAPLAGALEDLIECEEVGTLPLKGLLKPVPTFHVLGLKPSR